MGKYDDIINLPHFVSKKRPQMSLYQRSAQFAPFAALVGYDEAIEETARLVDKRIELSDEEIEKLNIKLQKIIENINSKPIISVTYFIPDTYKNGGKYVTITGNLNKIREYPYTLILEDNSEIKVEDIFDINFKEQ